MMSDITLPQGWSLPRLGELMAFKNGLNKGKDYFGHGTPIVNYMDVFNHSGMGRNDIIGLVDVTKAEKKAYSARRGDVFFTRTSETPEEVGISSVLKEDINDAVFSGFVLRGRPQAGRISSSFAEYCFASRFVREQIVASATYTTRALTNGRTLSAVRLPLPDNPTEQEAIAEALSDADGVVEGLERLIEKKRRIKQGAMQDLLTAKRRLPGFSGEWLDTNLLELADGSKKNFDDGDWIEAEHIAVSGPRLIQTGNIGVGKFLNRKKKFIHEASFEQLGCKHVEPGDVLVCRLAEPAGRACVVPDLGEEKMLTSVDVTIFRPNPEKAVPSLITEVLSQPEWFDRVEEASGGTTRKRIARSHLGRIAIRLPEIAEQRALATVFQDINAEITALETRLQKARQIKEGMMQNLLTGRIRLI